jgi:hypothetical protein
MTLPEVIRRSNQARKKVGLPQWVDPKRNRDVVAHGFRSTFRDWAPLPQRLGRLCPPYRHYSQENRTGGKSAVQANFVQAARYRNC